MKKKGFTLIELLAVIIVLGIIALIVIPTVNNILEDAKLESSKVSVTNYVKAIENNNTLALLNPNNYTLITNDTPLSDIPTIVKMKSNMAITDIDIDSSTGKVNSLIVIDNNTKFNFQDGEITSSKAKKYTPGNIVYYNVDNGKMCTSSKAQVGEGNSGCMKFYVITSDDSLSNEQIEIILDHNTTLATAYTDTANTADNSLVINELNADVSGWIKEGSARLLTEDDLQNIIGVQLGGSWFNVDTGNYDSNSNPAKNYWLFDNTNNCLANGCKKEKTGTVGYWLATPYSIYHAWNVNNFGRVEYYDGTWSNPDYPIGIRPVIKINK